FARICNDEMSAYCRQDPEHFDFWCHANLADPDAAVLEIERAVTQLGAKGVCVGGTNFNGIDTHDERLFPVWEKIEQLDVPIIVDGLNHSAEWGKKQTDDMFETTSIVGDCVVETFFFGHLICGGALDAFRTLRSYIPHAGGMAEDQL